MTRGRDPPRRGEANAIDLRRDHHRSRANCRPLEPPPTPQLPARIAARLAVALLIPILSRRLRPSRASASLVTAPDIHGRPASDGPRPLTEEAPLDDRSAPFELMVDVLEVSRPARAAINASSPTGAAHPTIAELIEQRPRPCTRRSTGSSSWAASTGRGKQDAGPAEFNIWVDPEAAAVRVRERPPGHDDRASTSPTRRSANPRDPGPHPRPSAPRQATAVAGLGWSSSAPATRRWFGRFRPGRCTTRCTGRALADRPGPDAARSTTFVAVETEGPLDRAA